VLADEPKITVTYHQLPSALFSPTRLATFAEHLEVQSTKFQTAGATMHDLAEHRYSTSVWKKAREEADKTKESLADLRREIAALPSAESMLPEKLSDPQSQPMRQLAAAYAGNHVALEAHRRRVSGTAIIHHLIVAQQLNDWAAQQLVALGAP
jgi:hypothetical protein